MADKEKKIFCPEDAFKMLFMGWYQCEYLQHKREAGINFSAVYH